MGWLNDLTDWSGMTDTGAAHQAVTDFNAATDQNTAQLQGLNNGQYYGAADSDYGQQQGAVNMLGQAALGNVPSAAQIQMGQGQAIAAGNIQAAALGNQAGMNPGIAMRNMLNAQSQAQGSIVGQGAAMRAQEQATARQQYAQAIQAMRGQSQQQAQAEFGNDMGRIGAIQSNNQAKFGAQTGVVNQNSQNVVDGVKAVGNIASSLAKAVAT